MSKSNKTLVAICLFVTTSLAWFACNNKTMGSSSANSTAQAVLAGTKPDTTVTGTVRFNERNGKVKMMLQVSIPLKANQSVAVHIHENGACGDMGKAAGGHWNPTMVNHGQWGNGAFHLGDIGNIKLDARGNGSMEMETGLWTITGTGTNNILNKGIILHGGIDDYTSQPAGNAGTRIGCGVIMLAK